MDPDIPYSLIRTDRLMKISRDCLCGIRSSPKLVNQKVIVIEQKF